jgi:hypothetical protein
VVVVVVVEAEQGAGGVECSQRTQVGPDDVFDGRAIGTAGSADVDGDWRGVGHAMMIAGSAEEVDDVIALNWTEFDAM